MATDSFEYITVSEAAKELFGVKLSKYPKFKNAINALLKPVEIKHEKIEIISAADRKKTRIYRDQLTKLFNAVLLQAFFTPAKIKPIFSNNKARQNAADAIELVMIERQSVLGLGLNAQEMMTFLEMLKGSEDLTITRLPNPFVELPQLSLDGVTNIMKELLTQSAALTECDSMVLHYLNDDIEIAYSKACDINSSNELVNKFKEKITQEYFTAKEFDETLDFFR
jgi:hypothetical protein